MKKQPVTMLLDEDRNLWVKTKDGTEYMVNIFTGSGYYETLWLQTEEDMAEAKKMRDDSDKAFLEQLNNPPKDKKTWKFWGKKEEGKIK